MARGGVKMLGRVERTEFAVVFEFRRERILVEAITVADGEQALRTRGRSVLANLAVSSWLRRVRA